MSQPISQFYLAAAIWTSLLWLVITIPVINNTVSLPQGWTLPCSLVMPQYVIWAAKGHLLYTGL